MTTGSRIKKAKPKKPKKKYRRKLAAARMHAVTRRYYRVPELAAELGLSNHTLWLWVRKGIIPSTKIGGAILLDRAQIEQLIEQRTRKVALP